MADEKKTDQLHRALEMLLDGMEKTQDFAVEQIPLVVQELIVWKRFWFTSQTAAFLVLGILSIWLFKAASRWCSQEEKEAREESRKKDLDGYVAAGLLGIGGTIVALIGFCISVYWASMVWFAPRVYILECLTSMVRGR